MALQAIKVFLSRLPWKVWIILGVIITVLFSYRLGYSGGMSDERIKRQLTELNEKNEILLERLKAQESLNESNLSLSNAINRINQEKHHEDTKTYQYLDELTGKYVIDDSVQYDDYSFKGQVPDIAARVRATRETVVVKLPDEWGFSSKDRRTLLQEAARADKVAAELQQCKATVNSIYQSHAEYKEIYERYKKQLSGK